MRGSGKRRVGGVLTATAALWLGRRLRLGLTLRFGLALRARLTCGFGAAVGPKGLLLIRLRQDSGRTMPG